MNLPGFSMFQRDVSVHQLREHLCPIRQHYFLKTYNIWLEGSNNSCKALMTSAVGWKNRIYPYIPRHHSHVKLVLPLECFWTSCAFLVYFFTPGETKRNRGQKQQILKLDEDARPIDSAHNNIFGTA